jgi:hypothetical protein
MSGVGTFLSPYVFPVVEEAGMIRGYTAAMQCIGWVDGDNQRALQLIVLACISF